MEHLLPILQRHGLAADASRRALQRYVGELAGPSVLTIRRSKSRRGFELPVPEDARDAVLRYARYGRPAVETRALCASTGSSSAISRPRR
jgi:hypothetical protein